MIIEITDNFKARQIYEKAIFYSKGGYENDAEVIDSFADNINNSWVEDIIKIGENKIRLRLYTPHNKNRHRKFGEETLDIEFFGDEQTKKSAKKRLEELTGIKLE